MDFLYLLDDVMSVVVGEVVLTHELLDETQLISPLVVDQSVLLLVPKDLLQVALCADYPLVCLLGLLRSYFPSAT
jgi:hypothetical protein